MFHLAAQAFVKRSLDDPLDTWTTNVNGTVNILEALKQVNWECSAVSLRVIKYMKTWSGFGDIMKMTDWGVKTLQW